MTCDEKRIDGLIERYFRGSLPNKEKIELAQHLSKCKHHRQMFETEGRLTDCFDKAQDIMAFEVMQDMESHVPTALMVLYCECRDNLDAEVAVKLEHHIGKCKACANEHAAFVRMLNADVEVEVDIPMKLTNRLLSIPDEIKQTSENHIRNERYRSLLQEVKSLKSREQKLASEKRKRSVENKNIV